MVIFMVFVIKILNQGLLNSIFKHKYSINNSVGKVIANGDVRILEKSENTPMHRNYIAL